jgi:hypothetical protein
LNGEANRDKQRQNRAIIAAEVRRFGRVINTDGVLGTHTLPKSGGAGLCLRIAFSESL